MASKEVQNAAPTTTLEDKRSLRTTVGSGCGLPGLSPSWWRSQQGWGSLSRIFTAMRP